MSDPHTELEEPAEPPPVEPDAEPSVPDLQRRLRVIMALGAAGLLLIAMMLINSKSRADQIDSLIETNKSQQVLIDKLATQLDAARAQGATVPAPEVVAAQTPGADVSPVETVAPGLPGERGDAGPAGAAGVGTTGAPGDVGSTGSTGSAGSKGDTGAAGDTGSTGAVGDAGSNGTNGTNGAEGAAGPAGPQGDPGMAGPPGVDGSPGVPGPTGPPGPAANTMTCTPSDSLDLSQPWSCVVTS